MNQTVEMPCRLLDLLSHIVIAVQVEDIGDKVKSVLIILDIRVEPSKVEAVREIVLVNFAEIFVSSGRDELHVYLSANVFYWYLNNNTGAKKDRAHHKKKSQ